MLPHLCFLHKGIRLILTFSCVIWLSVCTLDRPIGKEGCASWDLGRRTWGGRERGFGTVSVCVRVQEITKLDEVAESSINNLVSIPHECEVTLDNESESNELVKDDSSAFTTSTNPLFNDSNDFTSNDENVSIEESKDFSNPLFDDDEINSDELKSHVESNFVESLSNHINLKFDHLEEFSRPLIPIHIAEEERIRREHPEYISRFENDDSDGEVDAVDELHVDNSISNSKNELSDNEESDFDNPLFPRPPPEPPYAEFNLEPDSGEEISVVMNDNDELECLDPRVEFDVSSDENDDYSSFMFVIYPKVFSFLLSAESEDTIFDPGKDCAKIVKKQSKPDNIEQEIAKNASKARSKDIFCKSQVNKAKSQRITSLRAYLAISSKFKSKEKWKTSARAKSANSAKSKSRG
nr:hypothetical protein [Tanacetum cinerariifolium]